MTDVKLLREVMSLRLETLTYYKEAGAAYSHIQSLLEQASEDNPIDTDLGTFTSFEDFIVKTELNLDDAYSYMSIASNWSVLVKFGLHKTFYDKSFYDTVSDCVHFLDLYNELVRSGADPDELTLANIKQEDLRQQAEDFNVDEEDLSLSPFYDLIKSCDDAAFALRASLFDKFKALG